MQIDAHKRSLEDILKLGQHVIPRYQRRYAWTEQNIRDFWEDITSSTGPHFLGSMVVCGSSSQPREVIDGQQRLTTTLIALAALRNFYSELGDNQRVSGIEPYIEYTDRNGDTQYRLNNRDPNAQNRLRDNALTPPTQSARPLVEANTESREHQALLQIAALLRSATSTKPNQPSATLDHIRDAILETEIVYINVEDRKSAFTIFETLNDRGQSLTTMDLTKNLLFSHIDSDAADTTERAWSEILEILDNCSLEGLSPDLFLYYFWNSLAPLSQVTPDTVEQARLRRTISDHIDESADSEESARTIVELMLEAAKLLETLDGILMSGGRPDPWRGLDGRWRRDHYEPISAKVYGILVTGSNQPLPLLLSLSRAYLKPNSKLPRNLMIEFLEAIENFQFRWTISQKSSTSTIRRLYRHVATSVDAADSREDFARALDLFSHSSAPLCASDNQFRDGLGKLSYSNSRKKDVHKIRHILTRIEQQDSGSKLPLERQMSIEHLQGQRGRSEETRRNFWIFKLGNLTLLPPEVNSALPELFSEKSDALQQWIRPKDEVLHLAIADGHWDNSSYNRRQEALLEVAVEIWPIPTTATSATGV